jgi:hypothetical protein
MSKPNIYDYYVLVYKPKHHRAMGVGYVPEHILVAEKELNRQLSPDEDVRHINGNAQDNRATNLEIVSTNADYRASGLIEGADYSDRSSNTKTFISCKFQRQCWKEIRAPIARKNKVYLPYVCSYQVEGDIYKCSHFYNFIDKEMAQQKEEKE